MKKTFLTISILISAGLLFAPAFVLADYTYTRTPSGNEVLSPVKIQFSMPISEMTCENPLISSFVLTIGGTSAHWFERVITQEEIKNGIVVHKEILNLPTGTGVSLEGVSIDDNFNWNGNCFNKWDFGDSFIITGQTPFFAGGGIFTLPENAVASISNYIGDLINAIGPFLWLFIGVPLAFYVIYRFIKILP